MITEETINLFEAHYETEYALRNDIHFRKGEILKLEHINAKHCREIKNLESELAIRDIPRMKESLKSSARLALAQEEEIERLSKRINSILGYTPDSISKDLFDIYDLISDDNIQRIEFAGSILHKFGIGTMTKYEELVERGDIDIQIIDKRK